MEKFVSSKANKKQKHEKRIHTYLFTDRICLRPCSHSLLLAVNIAQLVIAMSAACDCVPTFTCNVSDALATLSARECGHGSQVHTIRCGTGQDIEILRPGYNALRLGNLTNSYNSEIRMNLVRVTKILLYEYSKTWQETTKSNAPSWNHNHKSHYKAEQAGHEDCWCVHSQHVPHERLRNAANKAGGMSAKPSHTKGGQGGEPMLLSQVICAWNKVRFTVLGTQTSTAITAHLYRPPKCLANAEMQTLSCTAFIWCKCWQS